MIGGVAGLAATLYLKPRYGRFGKRGSHHMSNPTNALLGTFMLWWGWVNLYYYFKFQIKIIIKLAFNTGSTYGISQGKWRIATRFIFKFKFILNIYYLIDLLLLH